MRVAIDPTDSSGTAARELYRAYLTWMSPLIIYINKPPCLLGVFDLSVAHGWYQITHSPIKHVCACACACACLCVCVW